MPYVCKGKVRYKKEGGRLVKDAECSSPAACKASIRAIYANKKSGNRYKGKS